jgi:acid phosphatase (class A)
MIGAARPHTTTLVEVAMEVGHIVGMYWKDKYNRARPVQVFPAVMPAIPTPGHPSYPSNHSFQSHLIAHILATLFEKEDVSNAMKAPLFAMAARIGENREIAGVHFPSDTDAGARLAARAFKKIRAVESFQKLCEAARQEWQQNLEVGAQPQNVGWQRRPKWMEHADAKASKESSAQDPYTLAGNNQ